MALLSYLNTAASALSTRPTQRKAAPEPCPERKAIKVSSPVEAKNPTGDTVMISATDAFMIKVRES